MNEPRSRTLKHYRIMEQFNDQGNRQTIPARTPRMKLGLAWIIPMILVGLIAGGVGGVVVYYVLHEKNSSPLQMPSTHAAAIPVAYEISTSVTDAVAEVGASVVTVISHLPSQRTFFGTIIDRSSSGSGVIVTDEGHIVTNYHVVEGAESYEITLADGTTLPAYLIGVDSYADLAVLKVDNGTMTPAVWGNSDMLKPGETVIAIGSPLGDFKNTVTVGVVSATERSIELDRNYILEGLIQTDAAINQGNSGGPLVNLTGQVVGINTLVVRGSAGSAIAEGLGFAIPSNVARAIVEQLIEKGYVARPDLGARWGWITPSLARRYRLPVEYGVYLIEIFPEGPCAEAGLLQGDIIISINGNTLDDEHPFINQLLQYEPGEKVTFTIVRVESELNVEVTLGGLNSP